MNSKTDLTPEQRALIQEFISRNPSRKDDRLYRKAFDHADKLNTAIENCNEKKIRFHSNIITPAAKLAAIDRNQYLVTFIRQYINKHGFPKNISLFVRKMRENGLTQVADAEGNVRTLNDRTVRYIVEDLRRPFSWPKKARKGRAGISIKREPYKRSPRAGPRGASRK